MLLERHIHRIRLHLVDDDAAAASGVPAPKQLILVDLAELQFIRRALQLGMQLTALVLRLSNDFLHAVRQRL